jgi:ricin-type beta-trefoil lectin protein
MCSYRHMTLSFTAAIAIAAVLAVARPARAEDAIVKLVSSASGKCLQPVNGSHNQGDAIVQVTCNGSAAQQWTVHPVSSTKVHLINRASHLCLDARGKAVNGTPIQQWTCNSISNENWGFGITNNLLASAVSNSWSHCIATPGNQDGLAMELRSCSNDNSQHWTRPNG